MDYYQLHHEENDNDLLSLNCHHQVEGFERVTYN